MKKVLLVVTIILLAVVAAGCHTQEYVTIEANQTAFLIPMRGDEAQQASFASEEMLAQAKVATKQVVVTRSKVKTGPSTWQYVNDTMLIIVDRTPITREWCNNTVGNDVGTSTNNQAIYAESKESIGFSVGINCSAQIYTEDDAVKFLYSYNTKSLEEIMDTEIRAFVEAEFVETCAEYTLTEILEHKAEIMEHVRIETTEYFAEKGITITVLGMKDGIEYDDPAVQAAINAEFTAERNAEAQAVENQREVDKAKADAEASRITAEAEADAVRIRAEAEAEANQMIAASLTDELLIMKKYEAWDGALPRISGDSESMIVIDENEVG